MSIRVKDLLNDERTLVVDTKAGKLTIAYQPSLYTADLEDRVMSQLELRRPHGSLAESLVTLLKDWDVLGEDGETLPIDLETLRGLPGELLTLIQTEINADMNPKPDERKNSGAGSRRAAKSANARSGTR